MRWIVPDFYGDFHCIASKCKDSCCIGWEIDIDGETAEKYRALSGELGEKLRESIAWEEPAHFILAEKERCPFLDAQNLCRIISAQGEEALCEICREHPRFHEWYGKWRESGVGMCCEEACRLLLSSEAPLGFIERDDEAPEEEFDGDEELLDLMLRARERAYAVLTDRGVPFWERVTRFRAEMQRMQDELDGFPPTDEMPDEPDDEALLQRMRELEPVDENWTAMVRRAAHCGVPQTVSDNLPERAAVYLCFRWLLRAAFDGDLISRAEFIAEFLYMLRLLLARGAADLADALRLLSKELEYME